MNRYSHSDSWEDPPEDPPEDEDITEPLEPPDLDAEIEDRDCAYWNNLK